MQQITTKKRAITENNSKPGAFPACKPFPYEGNVRAKQSATHLGIGLSTYWLFVKQGRISPPKKLSARISVWDAQYIRSLADNGIPPAGTEAAK